MLKEFRKHMGITQQELAEELKSISPKMDRSTVSRMETGIVAVPHDIEGYIEHVCAHAKMALESEGNPFVDTFTVEDERSLLTGDFEETVYERLSDLKDGERMTRTDLRLILGLPDRACRRVIEDMRAKGIRIASGGGAPGYYLAKTEEEYRAFEREYLSRAYKALATARAMRMSNVGQVVMNDR